MCATWKLNPRVRPSTRTLLCGDRRAMERFFKRTASQRSEDSGEDKKETGEAGVCCACSAWTCACSAWTCACTHACVTEAVTAVRYDARCNTEAKRAKSAGPCRPRVIMTWNCNGLYTRLATARDRESIQECLATHQPDVVCLQVCCGMHMHDHTNMMCISGVASVVCLAQINRGFLCTLPNTMHAAASVASNQ
jgi:hypothetical protein